MELRRTTRVQQSHQEDAIPQAAVKLSKESNASDNVFYLEGPWRRMPQSLIDDIELHLADGGHEDFAKHRWSGPTTLAHPSPETRSWFELFDPPHAKLPAGRFLHKKTRQIIVVGLPALHFEGQTRFVIVLYKKSVIFDPNNNRGCHGYNYCIWEPQHLRGPRYDTQKQIILRIYDPRPEPVELRQTKRTSDGRNERPAKKCRITLKISSGGLAAFLAGFPRASPIETLQHRIRHNVDQERPMSSSTNPTSSQNLPSLNANLTIATTLPEDGVSALPTPSEVAAIPRYRASVSEDAETITVIRQADSSTERIDKGNSEVNLGESTANEESVSSKDAPATNQDSLGSKDFGEETAIDQELTATQIHCGISSAAVEDGTDDQLATFPTAPPGLSTSTTRFKHENVIVIEDDDQPEVKKESTNTGYRFDLWRINVPPPSYYTGIGHPPAPHVFNAFQAVHSMPVPLQQNTSRTLNSQVSYENVRGEFRDNNDAIRDDKPSRRCASAPDFFEAAMEADIVEPNTRMFTVQVGAGRPTKMRLEDDESFREKVLEPLRELLNQTGGAMVTIRVHGLVYVRA